MLRTADQELPRRDEPRGVTAANRNGHLLRRDGDVTGGVHARHVCVRKSVHGHESLVGELKAETFRQLAPTSQRRVNEDRFAGDFRSVVTDNRLDPHVDQKIGTDIAEPNGPDAMWSIGNSGFKTGKFYAKAAKVPGYCKAATSATITR